MRKTVTVLIMGLILVLLLGVGLADGVGKKDESFDTTRIARTVQKNTMVKAEPDSSAETLEMIEEKESIVVLIGESVQDKEQIWYKIYSPYSLERGGYVPAQALHEITYDMLTEADIQTLYMDAPYLAVTRKDNTEGLIRPEETSPVGRIIPKQGTLVYLYSAYPGYAEWGCFAGYEGNWYYVMLPDHENFVFVRGTDLWILDRLPVHEADDFFRYLEAERPVKGKTLEDAYLSVLKKYQSKLNDVEKSKKYGNAKPVALWDINGDGIKELLFTIHDKTGFELLDDDGKPLRGLNFTELLIYSFINGEAINTLHLTAASDLRDPLENEGFSIDFIEKGILIRFVSSARARKTLIVEYGFDGYSFQELGKYHELYHPYEPGGGVVSETLPVSLLYESAEINETILTSFAVNGDEEMPGLSLREARTLLR